MHKAAISLFSFRTIFILPYLMLLMAGMMIPSDGSHGIFTIKSLAFISSVFSLMAYVLIYQRLNRMQANQFIFLVAALAFLCLWIGIAAVEGSTPFNSSYDQFKLLLLTLSVVLLTLFVAEERLLAYSTFLKLIIYSNFAYSALKLLIIGLYFSGLIDLGSFLTKMGIRYMTMTIYGDMTRLQTSVDITTPYLLYFVLQSSALQVNFSRSFKICYTIVSVLAVFFSFSRFLMGIAALAFFLHWCCLHWMKKIRWMAICLLIGGAGLLWVGVPKVSSVVESRFFSYSARVSDATRELQMTALIAEFWEHPLFGKGIGSYSERVIRDAVHYHSYEVQWMAFLMQFGLIGLTMLLIPLGYIGWQFWKRSFSFVKISYFILFIFWLAAGFFNPFLISLASGIIYALFAWTARIESRLPRLGPW